MGEVLENYLIKLEGITENPSAYVDPTAIVQDLKNFCLSEVSEKDLALCSSLIFNGEHNILKFLKKTLANQEKNFVKTREALLVFIHEYIKTLGGKKVQDYILEIKDTCFTVFRKEQSSVVKIATFKPMMKLLEFKIHLIDGEKLGVREMAESYLRDFTYSKASQTVKSCILQLLGKFAEHFPDYMMDKSKQLLQLLLDSLSKQFKSNKPDMQIISGSLKGLCSVLVHFSTEFTSDHKNIQALYQFISLSLDLIPHLQRYDIPKAGLKLVFLHASIIKAYLTEDSDAMFNRINNLCKHQNKKLRDTAFAALESFFAQVSGELVSGQRNLLNDQETFKFFIRKFYDLLESQSSGIYELSIAIRGLGYFAAPIQQFMGSWELKKILNKLFNLSERFGARDNKIEDTLIHFAPFMGSVANILSELETIEEGFMEHLENILATLFIIFPHLYPLQRTKYYKSMGKLFLSINAFSRGSVLKTLFSKISFQAVILTCSNSTQEISSVIESELQGQNPVAESSESEGRTEGHRLYGVYSLLWRQILDPETDAITETKKKVAQYAATLQQSTPASPASNMPPHLPASASGQSTASATSEIKAREDAITSISSICYDELVQAIIRLISKLDLGYSADLASDQPNALRAHRPKDFEVYLNLVQFCKLILPRTHPEFFTRWIYIFGKAVIVRSNEFPLNSGFYKLLTISMNICEKQNYFESMDKSSLLEASEVDSMLIDDGEGKQNARECFALFTMFVKEVIVRIQQYKDELLASCVELVLSLPQQFIHVATLVPALQIAFKMGYLPLAHIGLDAIEYWLKVVPLKVIPELPRILPFFNDWISLQAKQETTGDELETSQNTIIKRGATRTRKAAPINENDPTLEVQKRIIRLLGRLGGKNIDLIGERNITAQGAGSDDTTWDVLNRVKFAVPFQDLKPEIWIDSLLPRIIEVAESANDRQMKVSACEALHSLTLYMLGSEVTRKSSTSSLKKIYEHLFPALIRLACDVDQVTRQLFDPLLIQMIHLFTRNAASGNEDTLTLLDAIVDSLGNGDDGGRRDFSARCIAEFLRWSVKHTPEQKKDAATSTDPFGAKAMLKKLYSLLRHPNPYKRLGGALALNQIYKTLRDIDSLVDTFALEIIHNAIFGLKLCQEDESSLGTAEEITTSLEHMKRMVISKAPLLNKPNKKRRQHENLSVFVDWLFQECGRSEGRSRTTCMNLFIKLSELVPDTNSAAIWIHRKLSTKNGREFVTSILESSLLVKPPAKVLQFASRAALDNVNTWYSGLIASLDCYTWAFSNKLALGSSLKLADSTLIRSVRYLIQNVAGSDFLMDDRLNPILTPKELDKYHKNKSTAIQLSFKLALVMLETFGDKEDPFLLCDENFYFVLLLCILSPSKLGFNLQDSNRISSLLQLSTQLLSVLTKKLPKKEISSLKSSLKKILSIPHFDLSQRDFAHTASGFDVQEVIALLNGYSKVHECGLLSSVTSHPRVLADRLLTAVFDNADVYSPLEQLVAAELLNLSFSLGVEDVFKFLLDETVVTETRDSMSISLGTMDGSIMETQASQAAPDAAKKDEQTPSRKNKSTKGEIFYYHFQKQLNDFILKSFDSFAKRMLSNTQKHPLMFKMLQSMMDQLAKEKKKSQIELFLEQLFLYTSHLSSWVFKESNLSQKMSLLDLLRKALLLDPDYCANSPEATDFATQTFVSLMERSLPLSFKAEVLDILKQILSFANPDLIKQKLSDIAIYDFPSSSRDLAENSTVYNLYLATLNKLLNVLEASGSLVVLESLFSVLREREHVHQATINDKVRSFVLKLPEDRTKEVFQFAFKHFTNRKHDDSLRMFLGREICIKDVYRMPQKTLLEVYEEIIGHLMEIISDSEASSTPASSSYNPDGASALKKTNYIDKICAFRMLEALYKCAPPSTIKDVNKRFCTSIHSTTEPKGNELTQTIMRAAHSMKSETIHLPASADSFLKDIRLDLQCSAYNALAAVVLATQTKENFYTVFLFRENPDKGERLWENIVDIEKPLKLEVETNFPTLAKSLRDLKESFQADKLKKQGQIVTASQRVRNPADLRYLSSQYLADSSLNQEMLNEKSYFFAPNTTKTLPVKSDDGKEEEEVPASTIQAEQHVETIEMEMDELNSNPCMQSILELIDTMHSKFGEGNKNEMPKWMYEIHSKFNQQGVTQNVRLFLLKIVVNRPDIFAPYAAFWTRSILRTVTSDLKGSGFNYFIRDVCILLLKWGPNAVPKATSEDRSTTSTFMNYLVKNASYPVREIIRSNIEIVRMLFENWRGKFSISKKVIMDLISEDSSLPRVTGMQILNAMIVNGYALYDVENDKEVNEFKLFDAFLNNLNFPSREVYTATAEICGMILLQDSKGVEMFGNKEGTFQILLKERVMTMFKKTEYDRVLYSMYKIGAHFPSFLNQFSLQIFMIFPKILGEFRSMALQIMLWTADRIEDLFIKLQPEMIKLLTHRDDSAQLLMLKILLKLAPKLTPVQWDFFLPTTLTVFADHNSSTCRDVLYEMLMWIYDNNADVRSVKFENAQNLPQRIQTYQKIQRSLLLGLTDDNEAVSKKLYAFWDQHLSRKTTSRLLEIFQKMYSPDSEEFWLNYSVQLMLQLTHLSPDYDRVMFEGLADSLSTEYKEYKINTSAASLPMTPLFSASQMASQQDDAMQIDGGGMIRATAPSAGPSVGPSVLPSLSRTPAGDVMELSQSTSLYTVMFPRSATSQLSAPIPSSPGRPTTQARDDDGFLTPSSNMVPIKRRFKRGSVQENTKKVEAIKESQRKKTQTALRVKSARVNQVVMFRKYRIGELPDVQIKVKDILEPLQALSRKDPNIARLLFSKLFNAIIPATEDKEGEALQAEMSDCISRLLKNTKHVTPFVGFLLGLCYDHPTFQVTPQVVEEVSLRSFNFHSGIMLLEKHILHSQSEKSTVAKKRKADGEIQDKKQMWLSLAKLYKSLGEEDILRGLFDKEIAQHPLTKEAIASELKGDYVEALEIYEKATGLLDEAQGKDQRTFWSSQDRGAVPPTAQEEEYWESERLECLKVLTRWNDLADNTLEEIEKNTDNLWKVKYQDPYLDYFLQSHTKMKERWPELWSFIDNLSQDHREYLEKSRSADLSFMAISRNDFDRARFYVAKFYENFLNEWSKLYSFDYAGRHHKLQPLQKVVEMEEFLNFIADEKNFASIDVISRFLNKWKERYPSSRLDGINVWDDVISNRAVMLEKIHERFGEFWGNKDFDNVVHDDTQDSMMEDQPKEKRNVRLSSLKTLLISDRADIYRKIASAARKQNNFFVADHYLKMCLKSKPQRKSFMFPFFYSLVKLYTLKAKKASNAVEQLDKYVKAMKFIEGKRIEDSIQEIPNNRRKFFMISGELYREMGDMASDYPDTIVTTLQSNKAEEVLTTAVSDRHLPHVVETYDKNNIASVLYSRAYHSFDEAASISRNTSQNVDGDKKSLSETSKALLHLALFCDEILKRREESQDIKITKESLPALIITNILEAMALESSNARDRFPRLLELIGSAYDPQRKKNEAEFAALQKLFMTKTKKVPSWMFIRWISQMTALLDKPEGPAIVDILVEIAKVYPQAVFYPFKISSEDLHEAAKKIVEPLSTQLNNHPLLNAFVSSLETITHPEHRFKDWTEQLKPLVRLPKRSSDQQEALRTVYRAMYADVFDPTRLKAGSYNKKFATTWEKKITEAYGKDGSKLLSMEEGDFDRSLRDLNPVMLKSIQPANGKTGNMKLSDFSDWLVDFEQSDSAGGSEYIELPGQYSGFSKPFPENHVKVSSFDSNLLVLGSLRKPKRLKIHGNDEKDYPYLVKGGEDLRLDQRIEQLFSVMNQILSEDPASSKRRLKLTTYQVIPMTSRVGILEWVNNTRPLKEIIEEQLAKEEGKKPSEINLLRMPAAALHDSWVKSFTSKAKTNAQLCHIYYAVIQYASRVETERQLLKQHQTFPDHLLRRGIAALSSSPETYLSIRAQFARTLAVFSVASYIIGIGDRHLDNFLLNLSDGGLIGIDFGHAFGTATQFLPIPELIPFRLTRQFTNFLSPLNADGLLKHSMVHAMTAFRESKDVLLNTMDVFIKEPLIDWEKLARRVAKEQGGEEDYKAWFPKKKMDIVKRKLAGDNPAYITVSELKDGSIHSNQAYSKALYQIVLGDPAVNARGRVKEKCASVKEQVDCLVDQATDPNILGRTYQGWASWV